MTDLEVWRKRDLHLGQYEGGVRRGALGFRRQFYRQLAADLCEKYDVIVMEDFDLRATATKANDEDKVEGSAAQREQQRRAAPYELRQAIEGKASRTGVRVLKVSSVDSTRTCHACGYVCEGNMAEAIEYRCESCRALWDQDENAGRNILARGQAVLADREALAAASPAKKVRVARFAKRHKVKMEPTTEAADAA